MQRSAWGGSSVFFLYCAECLGQKLLDLCALKLADFFEHMLLGYPVNTSRECCDDAPDMLVRHCSLQCFSYSAVAPRLRSTLKNI